MLRGLSIMLVATISSMAVAQPFSLQGPGLSADDFRITTFAEGLNFPVGMAALDDGSLLVGVSNGSSFFGSSQGSLIRLADTDSDGVADVQQSLVSDVPGGRLSSVVRAGDLVAVVGQGQNVPISLYRLGANVTDPLTLVGNFGLNYPGGSWLHPHSSLAFRESPGSPGDYELYFQLGSRTNFTATTSTVGLISNLGLTATLVGDAVHRINLTDGPDGLVAESQEVVAVGLRNATGFAFHPVSGDLYIGDNGIDGTVDPNEPTSPDEIHVLPTSQLGGAPENFGFPSTFEQYRTGIQVGSQGIPPLTNFQPLPAPDGAEAEGVNQIAFAPPQFPAPLAGGLFAGFHGRFSLAGQQNEENAVAVVDPQDGSFFHVISNDEPGIGHLDGLLSTQDTLFLADISPSGGFGTSAANSGRIFAVSSLILPGDYNRDGVVDAADYPVWRDSLGESGLGLPADGDSDFLVSVADYQIWREAFGDSRTVTANPEPTSGMIAAMLITVLAVRLRHHAGFHSLETA